MPGLKTVVENVMFCLKEGQDFGNQAAHPHQEFLGVPPGRIVYFTITERIHARWLVESYDLWEYRPWKWRNMPRSASCFVFGFS